MGVAEIARRLDAEPLTHLMMGHRELFHSNLLAWFFETFPAEADFVFGAMSQPAKSQVDRREVRREYKNFDLLFQWPDRAPVLIENKIFSYPDEQQLADYAARITAAGLNPVFRLLSINDPGWPRGQKEIDGREWLWVSYHQLATSIRVAFSHHGNSYQVETLLRYADVVDLLSELAEASRIVAPGDSVALPIVIADGLNDARLIANMSKVRMWSVARWIEKALRASGSACERVETGFSSGTPLISWFVDSGEGYKVGWQLQGVQFRLAIIGTAPHILQRALQTTRHFDFSRIDDHLGTQHEPDRPLKNDFNRYGSDFLYRYKNVPKLSVSQLQAAAVALAK